jgi:hypothetical protein
MNRSKKFKLGLSKHSRILRKYDEKTAKFIMMTFAYQFTSYEVHVASGPIHLYASKLAD